LAGQVQPRQGGSGLGQTGRNRFPASRFAGTTAEIQFSTVWKAHNTTRNASRPGHCREDEGNGGPRDKRELLKAAASCP
jgi:hypothetical protein